MRLTYAISLLVLVLMVGILADRKPDTSAELLPIAGALGWVEGTGRDLKPELIGAGVRPAHVVRVGSSYVPRTPPALMLYYGGMCRLYREFVGRPLDGADLPRLTWWINFLGVLPWALLLFGALRRLAILWGRDEGVEPIWAAWAALAGSLAVGWFGMASPYLPVAALACWTVVLVLEAGLDASVGRLILAGLLAGFAGAAHPAGWVWIVWGALALFTSSRHAHDTARQTLLTVVFAVAAIVAAAVALAGNVIFFGTPMPVQWIDIQPVGTDMNYLGRLLWHDVAGWNGIIWLSPLILAGVARFGDKPDETVGGTPILFLLGLAVATLLIWGVSDDARLIDEMGRIPQDLRVLPVELSGGEFLIVQLGSSGNTPDERRAFYERLYERTDVFLWTGGRSPGLPLFLPAAVLLAIFGWSRIATSRFWDAWNWVGVRWGALMGLIMSQASYGSVSDLFFSVGLLPANGHIPMLEAILAVCVRLARFWPSGIVSF